MDYYSTMLGGGGSYYSNKDLPLTAGSVPADHAARQSFAVLCVLPPHVVVDTALLVASLKDEDESWHAWAVDDVHSGLVSASGGGRASRVRDGSWVAGIELV